MFETIQMGNCFAHREHRLVRVQFPRKQSRKQLCRAALCRTVLLQDKQTLLMVCMLCVDPIKHAVKRQPVGREHQCFFWQIAVPVD